MWTNFPSHRFPRNMSIFSGGLKPYLHTYVILCQCTGQEINGKSPRIRCWKSGAKKDSVMGRSLITTLVVSTFTTRLWNFHVDLGRFSWKGPLFSEVPLAATPETVSGHHWLVSNMNENLCQVRWSPVTALFIFWGAIARPAWPVQWFGRAPLIPGCCADGHWKPKERAPDADEILQAARTEAGDGYMMLHGTIQGFQAIRLCLKIGDPLKKVSH